jgi:uncharacterized protein (UPF0262 family)
MSNDRIAAIDLDERSVVALNQMIAQEREIAIADLLEKNHFRMKGSPGGPYHLMLSVTENRLVLDITLADGKRAEPHGRLSLSLAPFRKVIKDYFLVCDSYYKAVRTAPPHQMEALDMGRRALHDEGSVILKKSLDGKIETDPETARRLFTLICVLHLKS